MPSLFVRLSSVLPLPKQLFLIVWDYVSTSTHLARCIESSNGRPIWLEGQVYDWVIDLVDKYNRKNISKMKIDESSANLCAHFYSQDCMPYLAVHYYIALIALKDKRQYVCTIRIDQDLDTGTHGYIQWIPMSELEDSKWSYYLRNDKNVLHNLKKIRDILIPPPPNILFFQR